MIRYIIKQEQIILRLKNVLIYSILLLPVLLIALEIVHLIDTDVLSKDLLLTKILFLVAKVMIVFYISTILFYFIFPTFKITNNMYDYDITTKLIIAFIRVLFFTAFLIGSGIVF